MVCSYVIVLLQNHTVSCRTNENKMIALELEIHVVWAEWKVFASLKKQITVVSLLKMSIHVMELNIIISETLNT
jgi:hypothetical protein